MKRLLVPLLTVAVLAAAAGSPVAAADETTITLVTHDSFAASKSVLAAFTEQTGVRVKILRAGDAGSALNQSILTKDDPLGDVFFGVDNTFLSRAVDEGVFERYESKALASVPAEYQLDATHHLTPIDRGDVCINVDKRWFARERISRCRRHSPTSRSPTTPVASSWRTPRRRRPGSRSCSRRSLAMGRTAGRTTGSSCATTTSWWSTTGRPRSRGTSRRVAATGTHPLVGVVRVEPAGGRVLLEAATEDVADRHHARLMLPAGRVRGRARGHGAPP